MKIKYVEKSTFVDYPGQVACTIFLYGCSFRCGFCYNSSLVLGEVVEDVSSDSVLRFLETRKEILDGVVFTGGEPLLTLNKEFVRKVKNMGFKIKLDTNGSFPLKLKEFIDEDLVDYVAMDIKSSPEKYSVVAGAEVLMDKVEESIKLISSLKNYEFRTTVCKRFHDENEIEKIKVWLSGLVGKIRKYSLQGFKPQGDLIDESFRDEEAVQEDYLKNLRKILQPIVEEEIEVKC
jgi:pyruvate formate lyase activating enzyme